ncbi:MAG: mevalonate kinase [Woeseiaceae bacterium]
MNVASAPGKVVAVLDGAPAISLAVNRRAAARVDRIDADEHELHVNGTCEPGDFALFDAVLKYVLPDSTNRFRATLDTADFAHDGTKLGIGSSAALAAALTAALAPSGTRAEWLERAGAAHRKFQGGIGSGVDVATSCVGGLVLYRAGGELPQSLRWPDGLYFAVLWSGIPASTPDRLRALKTQSNGGARQKLAAEAESAAGAWSSGDVQAILEATGRYTDVLRSFSDSQRLDVFGAGHGELVNAGAPGTVYKPCGAGGGDVGMVLGTSDAAIASFVESAEARGFTRLDIGRDDRGVTLHEQEQ